MAGSSINQDAALAKFCQVTGADRDKASSYLANNNWDSYDAIHHYYEDIEAGERSGPSGQEAADRVVRDQIMSGPPPPSHPHQKKPGSGKAKPKTMSKFGSLKDLQGSGDSNHEDDSDKEQEFYAGGDKSGLAVQDPSQGAGSRDHIKRLMDTARRNGPLPPREENDRPSNFSGSGQTLGGDDTPSQIVQDPHARAPRPAPMEERVLHLWADGFSIDDGPLFRYDDPANAQTLDMINRGSAPLDIMNVQPGQAVEVKLDAHREQNYVQPKKKWRPFGNSGQRLGSPTPGPSNTTSSSVSTSNAPTTSVPTQNAPTHQSAAPATVDVDESQPVITLQLRLADGTRLPSRFNTTNTVGDVYSFVNRASGVGDERSYALATTFPTKELSDKTQVLGDMAEFKRGGVVVQKWQ